MCVSHSSRFLKGSIQCVPGAIGELADGGCRLKREARPGGGERIRMRSNPRSLLLPQLGYEANSVSMLTGWGKPSVLTRLALVSMLVG